jgi:hypothetical protein
MRNAGDKLEVFSTLMLCAMITYVVWDVIGLIAAAVYATVVVGIVVARYA